jgi:hypothetical protein
MGINISFIRVVTLAGKLLGNYYQFYSGAITGGKTITVQINGFSYNSIFTANTR